MKVGKSREAPFRQAWLTYEDKLLSHLSWESARDTRDCRQHKHGSGHAASSLHSLGSLQPGRELSVSEQDPDVATYFAMVGRKEALKQVFSPKAGI